MEFYDTYRQWVANVSDSLNAATYGKRYVFALLREKVLSAEIRLNWIFSPKISLQAFLQPLIAVGKYSRVQGAGQAGDLFVQPLRPQRFDDRVSGRQYAVDPDGGGPAPEFAFANPDFNVKSLRGTVVFRWEYRPGSTFYLVWTQNRQDFANPGDFDLGRDLGDLISAKGDNIFMIKATYRFNL